MKEEFDRGRSFLPRPGVDGTARPCVSIRSGEEKVTREGSEFGFWRLHAANRQPGRLPLKRIWPPFVGHPFRVPVLFRWDVRAPEVPSAGVHVSCSVRTWGKSVCGGGAILNIVGHLNNPVGTPLRAANVQGGSSRGCRSTSHVPPNAWRTKAGAFQSAGSNAWIPVR